jgi:hypothetical protein
MEGSGNYERCRPAIILLNRLPWLRRSQKPGATRRGALVLFAQVHLRQILDPRPAPFRHAAFTDEGIPTLLGGNGHILGKLRIVATPAQSLIANGHLEYAGNAAVIEIGHREATRDIVATDDGEAAGKLRLVDL